MDDSEITEDDLRELLKPITIEDVLAAEERVRRGEFITLEDLRRELQEE